MFKKLKNGFLMTSNFYWQELSAIIRDPGAMLILWGALIIYPITYAIAYKPELIREIKTIVVDLDNTPTSRHLIRMVNATEQINTVTYANSMDEAKKMFYSDNDGGIIFIPADFEKKLLSGQQADVSIYADGSYFLIYRQIISGATKAIGTFSAGVEIKKLLSTGCSYQQAYQARDPLSADLHFWFNPSSGYATFLMPGMILIILQQTLLIGIGMMGGTHKEKGEHKTLIPIALNRGGVFPVLFGRTLSYLTIYLFNSIFTLIWIYHWFGYPDHASILHVFMLIIPFLLSTIFLGITISVFFKRRESSFLYLIFLSPVVFFLSGVSWPSTSIPSVLYAIGHIIPSTIAVPAYIRLRIMGVGLQDIRHDYMLLLLQCGIYFITAALAIYFEAWHTKKKAA